MRAGRIGLVSLAAAAGLLVAGCAGHSEPAGTAGPAGSTGSADSPGAGQPLATFGNADKGKTVTVHAGQAVRVTLDTTNWRFDAPAGTSAIRWQPQAVAASSGACTVIDQCGSVSINGLAVQAGRATVHATREKCGEQRLCDSNTGSYLLTIVVTS